VLESQCMLIAALIDSLVSKQLLTFRSLLISILHITLDIYQQIHLLNFN